MTEPEILLLLPSWSWFLHFLYRVNIHPWCFIYLPVWSTRICVLEYIYIYIYLLSAASGLILYWNFIYKSIYTWVTWVIAHLVRARDMWPWGQGYETWSLLQQGCSEYGLCCRHGVKKPPINQATQLCRCSNPPLYHFVAMRIYRYSVLPLCHNSDILLCHYAAMQIYIAPGALCEPIKFSHYVLPNRFNILSKFKVPDVLSHSASSKPIQEVWTTFRKFAHSLSPFWRM